MRWLFSVDTNVRWAYPSRDVWPNITGSAKITNGTNSGVLGTWDNATGAFVKGAKLPAAQTFTKTNNSYSDKNLVGLDAKKANSMYSGTKNQPAAGLVLLCIKV